MSAPESVTSDEVQLDRRYRMGRVIAHGGMAVVREATHVYLRTQVAVKLLRDDRRDDRRSRERLLREAEFLVRARHPNVVSVIDAGECRRRGPFIAMELLHGRPLDGYLTSRGRLDGSEVVQILHGLALALDAIHARGIVHRDVKPANVMITQTEIGESRSVWVDFGISCEVSDAPLVHRSKLTNPGEIPGTADYMAPELLDGLAADGRVDLFAFGVLAFECLTGLVPYPGGIDARESPDLESSARDLLDRNGVARSVATVVARSISLDPARRFDSALAFWDALAAANSDDLVESSKRDDFASRRTHARAPYVAPLRVTTPAHGDLDGRTEDVGEGGVLLISKQPFVQGDEVVVRMPLPMSGRLETISAVVRWSKPGRLRHATGLSFDVMGENARDEIRRYVSISARGVTSDDAIRGPVLSFSVESRAQPRSSD